MRQTRAKITTNLAERLRREVARRDDSRLARRLYRTPESAGGYRLDAGAVLDDGFHVLQVIGVMALREQSRGAAIPREMSAVVPEVLLSGVKPWFGIERINALPGLLFSDAALAGLGSRVQGEPSRLGAGWCLWAEGHGHR